ncbi:MAG: hypothetical protein KJ002_02680 [Candidatus Dadabacteria bacterium]|nr:hypothetical protein [Candidatus Dadabacteria bacterium]
MKQKSRPNGALLTLSFVFAISLSVVLTPLKEVRAQSRNIPYSFFLEHPYSSTGLKGNLEIVSVDGGGALVMNQLRLDLDLGNNYLGLYGKFPFAGVTDGVFGDGDYDFGNIGVGAKYALHSSGNSVFTVGFETIFPTTSDDLGALGARSYFRDFAYFTDDAYTFVPYAVFAISGSMFALQANLDFDIMTNAKKANGSPFDTGGDSTELILKYGAAASLTPDFGIPFSTSFLLELLLASSTSFENNVTGAYVTPGVRVGGRMFSFGAGVQIPFGSSEITNFANVDFLVDMMVRFGG